MRIDNKTAISYINKKGGTKSAQLLTLALKFWDIAILRNLKVAATYLPSQDNKVADWLSRTTLENKEWMLNRRIFKKLTYLWNTPLIDLFASARNNQTEAYISWRWEDKALGTDAFLQDWDRWTLVYAYPEPILIGRVLKKLEQHTNTSMILICPVWTTQVWFPVLLRLLVDFPHKLPQWNNLIVDQQGNSHPLQEKGSLNLAAWKVSGNASMQRDFQKKSQNWFKENGSHLPRTHTNPAGKAGIIGVFNDIQIPMNHL